MLDNKEQQSKVAEEAPEENVEHHHEPFDSEMTLGGGAVIVETMSMEEDITLTMRAKNNMYLCYTGAFAGAGMFAESFIIFNIGNLGGIWKMLYPECYDGSDDVCNNNLVSSLKYAEIMGIIAGMLSFGYFADKFGRRWGSCTTALIMFIGSTLMTAAYAGVDNLTGMFIFFCVALVLFSYGVGGEYPLASASAAERAESMKKEKKLSSKHIRGKTVVCVFAMQGWGNWTSTALILVILAAYGVQGDNYTDTQLDVAWRLSYGVGALFTLCLLGYRYFRLKESKVWQENKEKREREETKSPSRGLVYKHFWHRILGAGGSWFVWDIVFYGNKLFQGQFISVIAGEDATLKTILSYTLINATVALIGYYFAAWVIDKSWMGRRRLQNLGFFMTFLLFLLSGVMYDTLVKPEHIGWFQFIYYLSSFFGQFGPNCTTWLLPSEVSPTDVRTYVHGTCASMGKFGALTATLIFTYGNGGDPLLPKDTFIVCAVCGILGLILTTVFVPDVTELDLSEMDKRWGMIVEGKKDEYHGEAVNPAYLSVYEKWAGEGANYQANH